MPLIDSRLRAVIFIHNTHLLYGGGEWRMKTDSAAGRRRWLPEQRRPRLCRARRADRSVTATSYEVASSPAGNVDGRPQPTRSTNLAGRQWSGAIIRAPRTTDRCLLYPPAPTLLPRRIPSDVFLFVSRARHKWWNFDVVATAVAG